ATTVATALSDNGITLGWLDFVTVSLTSRRSRSTCSHFRLSSSSTLIPVSTAISIRGGPEEPRRRRYSSLERKRVRGRASGRLLLSKRVIGFWASQPDRSAKEKSEDKVAR